jgi:tRNA(Ile)-lysidine synthase
MNSLPEKFDQRLQWLQILSEKKPLLALSGGLDSVVLFHLLRGAKVDFSVAHVNYGLRHEASDGDERFCRELCQKNGIPFFLYDAKAEMKIADKGIQETAREIRYTFFRTLCLTENFTQILTAHHANDSAETFFINTLRGSGIEGLRGIREENGNILRPLVSFSRRELEEYAEQNHIDYREDASNAKDDYLRNRIRHHVIPAMETADAKALERITDTIGNLSHEADLLDFFMKSAFPESISSTEKAKFLSFPGELQPTVIFKRYQHIHLTYSQAEDISVALYGTSGRQFFTSTHQILVDRDLVLAEEITEMVMEELSINQYDQIPGYHISTIPISEFELDKNPFCAFMDAGKVAYPLVWRLVKNGDSMVPFGMKGRKKISDIFIDSKLDRHSKARRHVLCSDDEIVWLEGYRINDSSKITGQTSRVLCIIPEKL